MDPAKRSFSVSCKASLRELGLTIEGEDSETEILHNDATETPLVKSEEPENKNLQNVSNETPLMKSEEFENKYLQNVSNEIPVVDNAESAYMKNSNFKTPLQKLAFIAGSLNFASNLQINPSPPRPNLGTVITDPNCNEMEIMFAQFFTLLGYPFKFRPRHLQIDASQPNLVIQQKSEIVEETCAPDLDQPNIIIPRVSETANLQISASQPNFLIQRESEIVAGTSAPHVKCDLEPPLFVDPVDITPEQSRGVIKCMIKEGTDDEFPGYRDKVAIHYDSYFLDKGKLVFIESDRQKECSEFTLGQGEVIKGWDLAISTMKKGEAAYFIILPAYGYGDIRRLPIIPPNTPILFRIDLHDWKPEDLSPKRDCSILRTVLEKGEGTTFPNEGSKVKIQLVGHYIGKVFEENVKEFTLGEGCCASIPEGIEIALLKFQLKEKSLIYLKDKYGFVSEIAKDGTPSRSPVSYEVTLLSFEKIKDIWEMNTDEKYERAKVSRERGIKFANDNNFKVALKHFKWIVTCLEKEPGADPKTVELRNSLLLSGYLNIAFCFLKFENYKDAIKFCDKALKMQPHNEKALFRRGQAKIRNNDFKEALQDFITVYKLYPENKAAKNCILSCRERIKINERYKRV